jgi:hypothetical protein
VARSKAQRGGKAPPKVVGIGFLYGEGRSTLRVKVGRASGEEAAPTQRSRRGREDGASGAQSHVGGMLELLTSDEAGRRWSGTEGVDGIVS